MAGCTGVNQVQQTAFALVEIGIGEGDDGIVQLGVVDDLHHMDIQLAMRAALHGRGA